MRAPRSLTAPRLSLFVAIVGALLAGRATAGERSGPAERVKAPEIVEPLPGGQDAAIQRTLSLLEQSAATYTQKRECFSCHHQTLPAITLAIARERGYEVDAKGQAAQAAFTLKYFGERRDRLLKGDAVPGGPFSAGYALVGLHAAGRQPDATTSALVAYLFQTQEKDGAWHIRTHRPPLEDSHFSATALALRGMQLFAEKSQADEAARRIGDARKWLMAPLSEATDRGRDQSAPSKEAKPDKKQPAAKPALSNEDRTFHLLGLHWCQAEKGAIAKVGADLISQQRADGGWAQTADMASDAYATGQALVALHTAGGLKSEDRVYRRGLDFLRQARLADGSWLVTTRSKPVQTYFESGFPHAKSQFISIAGACWATQALLLDAR